MEITAIAGSDYMQIKYKTKTEEETGSEKIEEENRERWVIGRNSKQIEKFFKILEEIDKEGGWKEIKGKREKTLPWRKVKKRSRKKQKLV